MQYVAFDPDIEILGAAVMATFGGFGPFRAIVERVLTRIGLADNDGSGRGQIDVDRWYLQQAWLDALREVDERYGPEVLFNIGAEIPNNAVFPTAAVDVHSAVR
ncbi:MAG: hypothetical protein KC431_27860, partial [Myxococcales bacterium]|nr:hypothetical protein [Myxococcales bacterium]